MRKCALVALLLLGCQGDLQGPPAPGGDATGSGGGSGTAGASGTGVGAGTGGTAAGSGAGGVAGTGAVAGTGGIVDDSACIQDGVLRIGRTRLRRMTKSQLDHSVRDLLGIDTAPAAALSPDESIGPFRSNAIAPITDLLVQQHDEIAQAVAALSEARMNEIAGCDLAVDAGTTCAAQFIDRFGLKAHRRPLDDTERQEYLSLYTLERGQGTAASAFRLVVGTMLESPFFLYHADVGASGAPSSAPVPVTSYEIASRLSYFLWDTMPDQTLFDLAAAGTLGDPAVLGAQIDRMLQDPRAVDAIPEFHLQWLGIRDLALTDRDAASLPLFSEAFSAAMLAEARRFTDHVVRSGDGLLRTLFTASFSFPEGPLFQLYGVPEPAGYVPGTQVALSPAERGGILTQAAFLTTHAHRDSTSPVHRGIMVRENILCQPLDPPPAGVVTTLPPEMPAQTTRDRFIQHEADPTCAGCHVLIDPIGLTFENYDAVGAYRTVENGITIDASGEILEAGADVAGPFIGAVELGQKLAESEAVRECVASQWFRFALGRMEAQDDACSLKTIREAFAASDGNVRSLIAAIVTSDAFRHVRSTE